MLFNSYTYLLFFLPLVLLGFHLLRRAPFRVSVAFLVVSSLIYYGWWDWNNLWIIGGSCIANFFAGRAISRRRPSKSGFAILTAGVIANLGILSYYKYAGFFAKMATSWAHADFDIPAIILPLGISFFTFQQVAYLVDAWRGETKEYHFWDYLLFVTFFPQLIAGPIVHHKEMLPQFVRHKGKGLSANDLSIGAVILVVGLFKKVVIADYLARTSTPLFDLAASGDRSLTCGEAWAATLAYALQIYFDFSGYSDMAIGSARLFGIKLPVNFHSPYKAVSVIDFWRRWHITLSRFLRDYLYIPLGGNRRGPLRRYGNLLMTMLLGGLWHGAGWTFLIWGGLHGLYLCINHGWVALRKKFSLPAIPKVLSIPITFLAVILAWIPFRAGNYELVATGSMHDALEATRSILSSMAGLHGLEFWPSESGIVASSTRAWRPICLGLILVWFLPNTQQFMRRYFPALGLAQLPGGALGPRKRWQWRPTTGWLLFTLALLYAVSREFDKLSEFIYFQF
ncbi:D-alanyl-lipoteichoic acid acyltransferase DltB (MBOAT superfamily) [Haloferula luteola]|uniref:D-alanyl-lipoteichoic acid acyltransferase DltB (MBOAT superfamily) n=1 Tax=Haloferula luteola TaxID=595692 RepID=A0A840V6I1_9BACT|nr:MBOAT family O-acyltransferase [Haloferula luteola]MBB5352636.1 D-alanyl-lipoteichoic acid acyltransferase DltB (MBOAT superfamily) [Haloferula luteola]